MIKLEAVKNFTLREFNKLANVKRKTQNDLDGMLYVGDTFECDEQMCRYLLGENAVGEVVAKVIEVIPEAVITEPVTEAEKPKKENKKTNKKKK